MDRRAGGHEPLDRGEAAEPGERFHQARSALVEAAGSLEGDPRLEPFARGQPDLLLLAPLSHGLALSSSRMRSGRRMEPISARTRRRRSGA